MSKGVDRIMPYAFPLAVVAIVAFYYFVNPLMPSFPIRCVWHDLTGTQCPACGFQRALHALMHGNLAQAISYNYFFVLSIPYAMLAVLATWYNHAHVFDKLGRVVYHRYTLKAYVFLYFFWWVLRNVADL